MALRCLRRTLHELGPDLEAYFENRGLRYTVARTEALQGEFRHGHNSLEIFLAESFFELDFGAAAAVFLHEHAHVLGYDASRGFTDALTRLI